MIIASNDINAKLQKFLLRSFTFICVIAALAAPQAQAASTFLLQLGSFDSETQASQKWDEVKAKNADVLGSFSLHISKVSMPPDNAVSYRAQVGPVDSYDKASKICTKLQNNGNECYIVETALLADETSAPATASTPTPAPAASSETPAPVATETVTDVVVADRAPKFLDDESAPAATTVAQAQPAPAAPVAQAVPEENAFPHATKAMVAAPAPVVTSTPAAPETVAQNDATASSPGAYVPGREPKFLDDDMSASQPAPVVAAAEPAPAAPAPSEKPGFFGRLFSSKSSTPPSTVSGTEPAGNVEVAEAIRVPLTKDNSTSSAKYAVPAIHGLGGLPNQTMDKTYWAQLTYFTDEAAAHSFYDQFHANYPQLTDNVRVRVTRPYSYINRPGHVSLRMGPFATIRDVKTLCSVAAQQHLRCTSIKDVGSSVAANLPRTVATKTASIYAAASSATIVSSNKSGVYWDQLGTYASADEAWDRWQSITEGKKKTFGKIKATVTTPQNSSADHPVYRLRAGPFTSEAAANSICNKLSNVGENCLVISEH